MNTYLLRDLLTRKINRNIGINRFVILSIVEKDRYNLNEVVDILRVFTSYGVMTITRDGMIKIYNSLLSSWYDISFNNLQKSCILTDVETNINTIIYLDLNESWLVDYLLEMAS